MIGIVNDNKDGVAKLNRNKKKKSKRLRKKTSYLCNFELTALKASANRSDKWCSSCVGQNITRQVSECI